MLVRAQLAKRHAIIVDMQADTEQVGAARSGRNTDLEAPDICRIAPLQHVQAALPWQDGADCPPAVAMNVCVQI